MSGTCGVVSKLRIYMFSVVSVGAAWSGNSSATFGAVNKFVSCFGAVSEFISYCLCCQYISQLLLARSVGASATCSAVNTFVRHVWCSQESSQLLLVQSVSVSASYVAIVKSVLTFK